MGTQFFWFFDILLVAIFLGLVYRCTRQGFAAGIVNFIGIILAFAIALGLSAPLSEYIYDTFVGPGVVEKITYENEASDNSANAAFNTLRNTDMSKALIDGKSIDSLELEPDSSGKVTLDLSAVDLSQTGITEGDLDFFGLDAKYDFDDVNVGKVDISASDYSKYDIEDIILARTVSAQIVTKAKSNYDQLSDNLADTMPGVSKASRGSEDLVSVLLINILGNDSDSLESAINNHLVRPVLITTFRMFVFAILFSLVCIVVSLIAKTMNLVNQVPVIGKINSLLGTLLGIVQAVIVIFMVCIGVKAIISLTGNNIIFLNTMTIDETFIFQKIYYINFLNF